MVLGQSLREAEAAQSNSTLAAQQEQVTAVQCWRERSLHNPSIAFPGDASLV